jgi:hypothetical protein
MAILPGFNNLKDRMKDKVIDVTYPVVYDAIEEFLTYFNQQVNSLTGLLVEPTTEYQRQYNTATHIRLQPLDGENGRARPVRVGGHYTAAWPMQSAGTALGHAFRENMMMTVEAAMAETAAVAEAYARWSRDQILSALFYPSDYTYSDDTYGDLTVKPLADGGTQTYLKKGGNDAEATDNHYAAQANAIGDSDNAFENAYNLLNEHPENGDGQIVHLIPSGLVATTRALATFFRTRDMNLSQQSDAEYLVGELGAEVPGEWIGYESDSKGFIVQWNSMPANYILSVRVGSPKPLRKRQYPDARLQGFKLFGKREDWPYVEQQFAVHEGYGAWNRVGAVVTRIGNASYAAPANFTTRPIP